MKTFKERIIYSILFAILASTSHLLAQNENRLETTNQVAGDRLKDRLEEIGSQSTDNNKTATVSEYPSFQIDQRAEITTNCNNSSENLNCYLMMNPAMVGETEEAIEKFIIGGKNSFDPSVECTPTHQESDLSNLNQRINPPSPLTSIQPAGRIVSSSGSYITRAAKALVSYLLYSPVLYSPELSSWAPHAAIQPLLTVASSPSVLGLGAFCSMLPKTIAQPTGQPTSWPTFQPTSAANEAFVMYSGSSINEQIAPYSITIDPDGSYIIGGCAGSSCSNSLLGTLNANGQEGCFNQQSVPSNSITVQSTTIMNNELYSAGLLNDEFAYISKNNLTNGDLLSAWGFTDVPSEVENFISILPTSQNTLIAFAGNYGWEFDPYNSTVLSAVNISSDYSIQTVTAINDTSYIVGGAKGSQGFLSQISLVGTNWRSDWTSLYSTSTNTGIFSVAARNNTVIFGGSANNDGFIGSVDATTGTNYWSTSIGGTKKIEGNSLYSVIFASSDLNNTNQIMAGGFFGQDAWYVLMNLNNGTLSQSVILESPYETGVNGVVANADGTFTSIGFIRAGSAIDLNLMFVTLNENLEINPNLLPSGFICTSNNADIVLGAQNISTRMSNLTFSPTSLNVTDITSQFSTVTNNPITQSFPALLPTASPSTPSSSSSSSKGNNTSSIIIGSSVGGVAIMAGALYAAYRKMVGDYLKEHPRRSTIFEGDVEQSFVLPRPSGSFSREPTTSSSMVRSPSNLSGNNNTSFEEQVDVKDRPSDLVTDQPPTQYTEQVSPMH